MADLFSVLTPIVPSFATFMKLFVGFMIAIPLSVVGVVMAFLAPYKHKAIVREHTGAGIKYTIDRVKEVKKDGVTVTYQYLKNKVELPPPQNPSLVTGMMKRKLVFNVAKHLNGLWQYVAFNPNIGVDTELDTISIRWVNQKIKEKRQKHLEPTWWEANKAVVVPLVIFGIAAIVMIVLIKYNADLVKQGMAVAKQLAASNEVIADAIKHAGQTTVAPPPGG